jgi:hypothetical protein
MYPSESCITSAIVCAVSVASGIETSRESIRRDLIQAVRAKAAPFNACFSHGARNEHTVGRSRLSVCTFCPQNYSADIDEVW